LTLKASRVSIKPIVCAGAVLLLIKEKLILLLASAGYVALRLAIAVIFVHRWDVVGSLMVSGGIVIVIVRTRWFREYKPSYVRPKGMTLFDLFVGLGGLGTAITLAWWMKR
jgi:hypothetical protein